MAIMNDKDTHDSCDSFSAINIESLFSNYEQLNKTFIKSRQIPLKEYQQKLKTGMII